MSERVIGWDELKVGQRVRIERERLGVRLTYEGEILEASRRTARLGCGPLLSNDDIVSVTLLAEPIPPEPPVGSLAADSACVAILQADGWKWVNAGDDVLKRGMDTAWARLHAEGFRVVRHGWDGEQ